MNEPVVSGSTVYPKEAVAFEEPIEQIDEVIAPAESAWGGGYGGGWSRGWGGYGRGEP